MSSVVDELSSIYYGTVNVPTELSSKNKVFTNKDEHFIDQLTDQANPSYWVYGN
ncbi:unnamed protein product, partial [Rotaria sp. Silwood1]